MWHATCDIGPTLPFFSQIRHRPNVAVFLRFDITKLYFYCLVNISFTRTIHQIYLLSMRHATCDISPTLPFFSQIRRRPTVPFFLRFDITQLYFYCLVNIYFTTTIHQVYLFSMRHATCDIGQTLPFFLRFDIVHLCLFFSDSTSPKSTFTA